jgi:hypothetical protein
MKKDIKFEEVKDIAVTVVKEFDGVSYHWNVYLLNLKNVPIKNVIISSRGYGTETKSGVKTSTLRFFFEEIQPMDYVLIEPIMENVFSLNNEYWVSFYIGEEIQDKQFIFLPDSIIEDNFVSVPLMNTKGVMIK